MTLSRRDVLTGIVPLAAGASLSAHGQEEGGDVTYQLHPIGRVEKFDDTVHIHISEPYIDGLLGLGEWSHINVLYWFDKNDTPEKRAILRVRPRRDKDNPLTGVFACRAPVRPNLIALTTCKLLSVEGGVLTLESIDAFDGTPVLDIKPVVPSDVSREDLRLPDWTGWEK